MLLHNKIRDIEPGEVVKVIATDPSTARDIPKFCTFLNHPLLQQQREGDLFIYFVQKKPPEDA
ncbi:sulfurtransferase TusA family protein [Gynuella sp.]|uniref:sulfurtransferase TusA family protein n=1 Tax=Gynuella sp. TaxID=2969146 RepID=UPI003D10E1FC